MDRDRWYEIKELFDDLASRTPEEQDAVLRAFPEDRAALRADVERLLVHARRRTDVLLDGHVIDLVAGSLPDPETLGRFRIERRLGAGGMGVVYAAFDPLRNTRVALKVLTRLTPAATALFKHEFRSLAGMHHPHLVTLYDFFELDQQWFFTMEHVDGLPLTAWLDTVGDRWSAVRHALAGLASALAALHSHGKLHRDLKPSNILVTPDQRVLILDFGLVADAEISDSAAAVFAGTPRYMSPEQLAREPLTTASDCYALGIVLFEVLTGATPARPALSLARGSLNDATSTFGPLPGDLVSLCDGLLREIPADRLSAADVLRHIGGRSEVVTTNRQPAASTRVPLLGRDEELRRIADAIAQAGAAPVVITIEGPSGIGKTALATSALAAAGQHDATTLSGSCRERETITFNLFDSVIDALSDRLLALDPVSLSTVLPPNTAVLCRMFPSMAWLAEFTPSAPAVSDRRELRRTGGRVLRELLTQLAQRAPLTIFVDDVQWADADSVEMLTDVLAAPGAPPIALIFAFRTDVPASTTTWLSSVVEQQGLTRVSIVLDTLGLEAATAVANALLGDQSDPGGLRQEAPRIARESGGHPFFISELVQYARRVEPGTVAGAALTLRDVIHARAQMLPGAAQRLLETVTIAIRPIRTADALMAALDHDRSPTWLALLRIDRFVRVIVTAEGEFVEPFHDRLRETIVGGLSADVRQQRHRALAVILERAPFPEPEMLAVHYEGGGEPERASRYFVSAAEHAAAALAFNNAITHYDKALALQSWPVDRRLDLERARAEALANAGRVLEAAQAFAAAASDGSPAGLTALSRAGYHYAASGRITEAKQAFASVHRQLGFRTALESRFVVPRLLLLKSRLALRHYRFVERAPQAITPLERTRIDAHWFVGAGLGLVELITGALFTTEALQLALRAGDPSRIARSLAWEAATAASQSRRGKAQAVVLLDVCRDLVERLEDPYCTAMLSLCEGLAEFSHGRWASAHARLDRAEQILTHDCVGVSYELATLNGFKLQTCVYAGAYAKLRAMTPHLLEQARISDDLYSETFIRGAILPLLYLADDRPDQARTSIAAALAGWTSPGYHLQHALIDQVRFCVELYDDRAGDAVALVEKEWPLLKRAGLLFNQNLRAKLLELRAKCLVAALTGEPRTITAAERAVWELEREEEPPFRGSVLAMRAAVGYSKRADVSGRSLLKQSASVYEEAGMADYAAAARFQLALRNDDRAGLSQAGAWMNGEGIQNPGAWARMRTPLPVVR